VRFARASDNAVIMASASPHSRTPGPLT